MARKKPEGERLVPVTTYVRPSRYDELERRARARGLPLSTFLRHVIDPESRTATAEQNSGQTLIH